MVFLTRTYMYDPFGSRTLLSGSRKNSGNIGFPKRKPKTSQAFPYNDKEDH